MNGRRGITQIDMTKGAIWKQILLFSMPLLVGNFINQDALAPVSSSNSLINLLFVVVFHWGTAGVGYATITAQAVSAVCVPVTLMNAKDSYRLMPSKLKIDRRMMVRILKLGIPSGIQQSIISLSNVIVQSNINGFGPAAMAGFGAYSKVDGFAVLPLQSFCMAATTFTGQNIGAGKPKRVKATMVMDCIYSVRAKWIPKGD